MTTLVMMADKQLGSLWSS